MRSSRFLAAALPALACALAIPLSAQTTNIKPGLYDVVSDMIWVKSPFPNGMTPPTQSHSTKSCLTQEQINKFSGPPPQTQRGCVVSGVHQTPAGTVGTLTCKGEFNGSGNFEVVIAADGSYKTTMDFTATFNGLPGPAEFKVVASSVYKGPDCGDVKPYTPPQQ